MPAALGVEHSFAGRRWILPEADELAVRTLSNSAGVSAVLGRLLAARGITASESGGYLNPTLKSLLPEPLLLKGMHEAVARTARAIADGERIAVFGDYDVDGSCSAALLSEFLSAIGRVPIVYIPDRLTEGYGPSEQALLHLKKSGAGLVVTVDCGATADTALRAAKAAALDVIVLDHHAVERAHEFAYVQVNPNQPGDASAHGHLCAAGVTFLFLVALNRILRETGWYASSGISSPDLRESVDLVGLATVCDVVPLVGVNRAFVRAALARMAVRPRAGIKALAELARADGPFTPYHFGFVFGPRINAGGRVGRCSLGVELLTAADDASAIPLAMQLERHNRERKTIEAIILEEAEAQARVQANAPFVLVSGEGWHPGVVGIIAGRLKERFAKPALAIGFENGTGRGSARSVPGIDIGAITRAAREHGYLDNGGGHAMAAGFSIAAPRLDAFRDFLMEQFALAEASLAPARDLELHAIFSAAGATPALIEEIDRAGPFGAGNPEPVLATPDLRVAYADVVGKSHVRVRLEGGDGSRLQAIAFRAVGSPLGDGLLKSRGRRIHAAGSLKSEQWNGQTRVQLLLRDAAPAEA